MKLLILMLLFSLSVLAQDFSIMTFNTMCDFCKGSDLSEFDQRLKGIRELVSKSSPDLISLQELRSAEHLKYIQEKLPEHKAIVSNYFMLSYADPAILYNSKKFTLIKNGQFWLGPNEGRFSFGWKYSLPRQVHWAKLRFKDQEFIFLSTHLDNRLENMSGSAALIRNFLKQFDIPIIIAADTNMTIDMPQYEELTNNMFKNAFDLKKSMEIIGKYNSDRDLCYLKKGKHFPECRVDHVLISDDAPFKVLNFAIDSTKSFNKKFPSDHRPVLVRLSL